MNIWLFDNPLPLLSYSFLSYFKKISSIQWLFWVIFQNKTGVCTSLWCTFSA